MRSAKSLSDLDLLRGPLDVRRTLGLHGECGSLLRAMEGEGALGRWGTGFVLGVVDDTSLVCL